ncbi:MAG: hypothetical protein HY828_05305, partial [Actinobacteria bacterium]|nr:hypothetical protein [Actinomycetota bacterium]
MKNNRRRIGVLTALTGGVMALGSLVVGPGSAGASNTNVNVSFCNQVGASSALQFNGKETTGSYTAKDSGNNKLFNYTITDNRKLNISNVSSSITIVKIVVKGADAYNVYNSVVANMKSPDKNGKTPEMSHWFACYTTNQTTTTTAKPTTTTAKPTTTTSDDDECDDEGYDRSSSNHDDDDCDDECDDDGYDTESKQHDDDDCDDDHATTTTVKATTTTAQETTTTAQETTTTAQETTTTAQETTT